MILALICRQNLLGNLYDVMNNNNANLILLYVEIMETTIQIPTHMTAILASAHNKCSCDGP